MHDLTCHYGYFGFGKYFYIAYVCAGKGTPIPLLSYQFVHVSPGSSVNTNNPWNIFNGGAAAPILWFAMQVCLPDECIVILATMERISTALW